ncbi:Uncharacterised protein [Salmonella enterica subsp. enterica serovar Bovismorbificans]|uniref:Uncharacterized protein n=1 Tax=Salmonella enterica subsp. enterica serovar Bovismorbificans TaxID=58097 RepID=A0A655CA09_SALET|nr:Uncharacterised protein [Salmonella enterica subsp. enterica serovar Bovismorbificans]CPR53219.1 Uncharacterised protein [Salmonella enterica subsp. enterica serovar Bovismorbificans]
MRHEHCGGCGANGCDNAPGAVKLFYGFDQQRAVAKALGAFNSAGQHDDVIIAVGNFNQRRIRQ